MKLERKITIIGLCFLLTTISIWSALGTYRTITSSNDNLATFITNSAGYYYNATGPNIQLAINSLNSTKGGTVLLPSGTFTLTSPLRLWKYEIALLGSGACGDYHVTNATIITGAAGVTDSPVIPGADSTFRIENIVFNNGAQTGGGTDETRAIIYLRGCGDHNVIRDCMFNGALSHCIYVDSDAGGTAGLLIQHCQMLNFGGNGIYADSASDFWIDTCDISATGKDGIFLHGGAQMTVSNCLTYLSRNGIVLHAIGTGSGQISIIGCHSHDNTNAGFLINSSQGVITIVGCTANTNLYGYKFYGFNNYVSHVTMNGCTSNGNTVGLHMRTEYSTLPVNNNTITGCSFSDTAGAKATDTGINISNQASDITIKGCIFSDLTYKINVTANCIKSNIELFNYTTDKPFIYSAGKWNALW